MVTWLHSYMVTWLHGYMVTWVHGYMVKWLLLFKPISLHNVKLLQLVKKLSIKAIFYRRARTMPVL